MLNELEKLLDYPFTDLAVLETACTHKSFGNEKQSELPIEIRDNERMEFLGDSVLGFVISQMLLETYPKSDEGELSRLRASLVNEKYLAQMAKNLNLGSFLKLGNGEDATGGRQKDSILASTYEAVIAAVFMDGGFQAIEKWIRKQFAGHLKEAQSLHSQHDFKTKLQEWVQGKMKTAPLYEVTASLGPDHDKTFEVALSVNGKVLSTGSGKSKKEAEQAAAKAALETFKSS